MMYQSLFWGTKIRKIFQNVICFYLWGKLSFECGDELFRGLVLCGANCLEAKSVVSDVLSDINDKYGYTVKPRYLELTYFELPLILK